MDPGEDAYIVLGVTETATDSEIKKAYRKLALQHHPDRHNNGSPEDGQHHHVFAKISNAYEILSNPQKRKEYDRSRRYGMPYQDTADDVGADEFRGQHHSTPFMSRHDFFADLHDPFELFEKVFQQEFGRMGGGRPRGSNGRRGGRSPFEDPFFASPFGGGSLFGGGGGSMFGDDPFFSSARSMMMNNDFGPDAFSGGGNVITSTSTSSFGGMGGGGSSVSTSTTTRVVNGKRETVTERVVRHPDGRVERQVDSSNGNGDPAKLTSDRGTSRRKLLSGQARPRSSTNRSGRSHKKPHVVDLTDD